MQFDFNILPVQTTRWNADLGMPRIRVRFAGEVDAGNDDRQRYRGSLHSTGGYDVLHRCDGDAIHATRSSV